MTLPRPARGSEAGVTLIEMLVALALFALIGAAGFSVLDQILRVQAGTDGRLAHLASLQRAMHLTQLDFMQAAGGSLAFDGDAVAFRRAGASGEMSVRYALEDQALVRSLSGGLGRMAARQVLLTGVDALDWRFFSPATGWLDGWPPPASFRSPGNPAAVALDVTLSGSALSGHLRRVTILPSEARR